MNTKKIIFGMLACLSLLAVSCEPNSTADEDQLNEVGIEKSKLDRKI